MKIRKEQFLLPKGKTINSTTSKWIQSNRKPCEFSKSLSCTSVPPQPSSVEGLPSALITKIKSDVLLSNGEIIVSGKPAGQLIWQQQDGILRQALLSTEKDVKSEDKVGEVVSVEGVQSQGEACVISGVTGNTGLLAITAVTSQQLAPVAASQVIKMNDYQVILSSETLPVSWQDKGKKSSSLPNSTLPPIKPKMDPRPGFVIGEQPVSFASIGSVNVLTQNQFPAIVIKDGKTNQSGNLVTSNTLLNQLLNKSSTAKKPISKLTLKPSKMKKKPIAVKKIMLKPASSLLSQTALDCTNKDRIESQVTKSYEDNNLGVLRHSLNEKSSNDNLATDYTVKSTAKSETSVINNSIPTSNIIITTQDSIFSFNSNLSSKPPENNLSLTNFTAKNNYAEDLNADKSTESEIVYDSGNVNVIGHAVEDGGIIMTTRSCDDHDQTMSLGNTAIVNETVLIDSNTRVICSDGQTLLHTGVVVENCDSENTGHNSDIIQNGDYHTDHVETILPSDIEHHEEHHTQEYTDNLLSQLSNSRVLPNMSSSQVSSVLNALGPSSKTDLRGMTSLTSSKNDKEPVKCEPTEFVKIESLQLPNIVRLKTKAPEPKYRVCELNKHTCYRCVNCTFLSLKTENVEKHWAEEHQHLRSELLDKQMTKRQIKCLGCSNIVFSKYALQIHLLCDHNVVTTEVHELIAAMLAANRPQRDLKRPSTLRPPNGKTRIASQQSEPNKTLEVDVPPSTTFQPSITPVVTLSQATPGPFVAPNPPKVDEQKHSQDAQIPPTPSFSLFSEIQLPGDKEESLAPAYPPEDDDKNKLVNGKKCCKSLRRTARSKLRAEYGSEIEYNYRCLVERCGVRFSSADNLSYHLRCHWPGSEMFHCPVCEVTGVRWRSLTAHLWRQHKIDIDLYSCNLCGYKCNSYSKLINNHIKIHGDERPFLCDICGKGFKTTKQLRNHKGIHRARRKHVNDGGKPGESESEEGESIYVCKICSRSFADARILRHHTENVHNKLRPFLCTFCSHTASSKSSLRMHIRQHTGEKPFSCNECEYVTSDHNSLRRHKMRHSGKRPYQCPHCTYNCIQATTYKSHLKNKHPGMDEGLMFSCPMCPFRTVKKDNYLAHKAEHDLGGDPRNRRKKLPVAAEIVQLIWNGLESRISDAERKYIKDTFLQITVV